MASTRQRIFKPASKPATSIIVPVLGETDNVMPLVRRVRKAIARRSVEILFVVDDLDFKTVRMVRLANKKYGRKTFTVRSFHRTGRLRWGGLSGAVVDGINRAKSDRIIVMDGDLQHPPEVIPSIIKASNGHDLVVASRYCKGGKSDGLNGVVRHVVSRGSTFLAKTFFPLRLRHVSDPMTGFFLVDRQKLHIAELRPKGFKILLEILASTRGLKVKEVPLQFAERNAGKSHGSLKQGTVFLSQLVGLRFRRQLELINRIPKFIVFGAVGGGVFVVGMALLFVLVEKLNMPTLMANAIQLVVTFWLNYVLNRRITWKDRTVTRLAAHKFLVSRIATTILNYLMFAWLITQRVSIDALDHTFKYTSNYLVGNVITLVIIMMLNFIISDRWAFAEPRKKTREGTRRFKYARSIISRTPKSVYLFAVLIAVTYIGISFDGTMTLSFLMAMAGLLLFVQSCIEVWRIIYAYREPESIDRLLFPVPKKPREKFCVIVPARHESAVLAGTLKQLARQTHPNVHIITVICDDDHETMHIAYEVESVEPRVSVMVYHLEPDTAPSKPRQLNFVLGQIEGQGYSVIGVFDAEDTVQEELLKHVDTAFRDRSVSVVQGGVQLMNHDTAWYSLHNVLEYYRWFNSSMLFQADNNFIPLGGNTIFIREKLLRRAGGWPETLTEDCSLGVLLSARYHIKTAVYYDPLLATREETPDSLRSLFRQRVRWSQGFYHEWRKGIWQELPSARQRLLADYILLSPVLLAAISMMVPLSLIATLLLNAPVGLVMLMYLPLIPASLHVVINSVMLRDFGKAFHRKIKLRHFVILYTTQIVYQVVLNLAALWAVVRENFVVNLHGIRHLT